MLKLPKSRFPQQVGWRNWWIPTAAPMTELVDSHSRSDAKGVLFDHFWTLWPDFWHTLALFGENCLLKLLLVWGQKKLWTDKKKSPYFPFKHKMFIYLWVRTVPLKCKVCHKTNIFLHWPVNQVVTRLGPGGLGILTYCCKKLRNVIRTIVQCSTRNWIAWVGGGG